MYQSKSLERIRSTKSVFGFGRRSLVSSDIKNVGNMTISKHTMKMFNVIKLSPTLTEETVKELVGIISKTETDNLNKTLGKDITALQFFFDYVLSGIDSFENTFSILQAFKEKGASFYLKGESDKVKRPILGLVDILVQHKLYQAEHQPQREMLYKVFHDMNHSPGSEFIFYFFDKIFDFKVLFSGSLFNVADENTTSTSVSSSVSYDSNMINVYTQLLLEMHHAIGFSCDENGQEVYEFLYRKAKFFSATSEAREIPSAKDEMKALKILSMLAPVLGAIGINPFINRDKSAFVKVIDMLKSYLLAKEEGDVASKASKKTVEESSDTESELSEEVAFNLYISNADFKDPMSSSNNFYIKDECFVAAKEIIMAMLPLSFQEKDEAIRYCLEIYSGHSIMLPWLIDCLIASAEKLQISEPENLSIDILFGLIYEYLYGKNLTERGLLICALPGEAQDVLKRLGMLRCIDKELMLNDFTKVARLHYSDPEKQACLLKNIDSKNFCHLLHVNLGEALNIVSFSITYQNDLIIIDAYCEFYINAQALLKKFNQNNFKFEMLWNAILEKSLPKNNIQLVFNIYAVILYASTVIENQNFRELTSAFSQLMQNLDNTNFLLTLYKSLGLKYCPDDQLSEFFCQLIDQRDIDSIEKLIAMKINKLITLDFSGETLITKIIGNQHLNFSDRLKLFMQCYRPFIGQGAVKLSELLDKKNENGKTSLHLAIENNNNTFDIVHDILILGGDALARNQDNQSALYMLLELLKNNPTHIENTQFMYAFSEIFNKMRLPRLLNARINEFCLVLNELRIPVLNLERFIVAIFEKIWKIQGTIDVRGNRVKKNEYLVSCIQPALCAVLIRIKKPSLLYSASRKNREQIFSEELRISIVSEIKSSWDVGDDFLISLLLDYKEFYDDSVLTFLKSSNISIYPQELKNKSFALFLRSRERQLTIPLRDEETKFFNLIQELSRSFSGYHEVFLLELMSNLLNAQNSLTLKNLNLCFECILSCSNREHEKLQSVFKERVLSISLNESSTWLSSYQKLSDYLFHKLFSFLSIDEVKTLFKNEVHSLQDCFSNQPELFDAMLAEYSQILDQYESLQSLSQEELNQHAQVYSDRINLLAVLKETLRQTLRKEPHHLQMLCVLAMIILGDSRRVLAQVGTGQGKSIILALNAAYQALHYKLYVDIITTTEHLMTRDATDLSLFYGALGLTVITGRRTRDSAGNIPHILYTSPNESLRVHAAYSLRNVSPTPMSQDEIAAYIPPYRRALLVDEIDILTGRSDDNAFQQGVDTLTGLDWIYPLILNNVRQQPELDEGELEALIMADANYQLLATQPALHWKIDLIHSKIPAWLASATGLAEYVLDRDYSVSNGAIVFINQDTGIQESNAQMANGVTQFLQYQNEVAHTPELLVGFCVDYESYLLSYLKLFGVSGTFGLTQEQQEVAMVYAAVFFMLPHFRKILGGEVMMTLNERPRHLGARVINGAEQWANEITRRASTISIDEKRPVLIVVNDDLELNYLSQKFQEGNYDCPVQVLNSGTDQQTTEDIISVAGSLFEGKGAITIVTLVGSRGIDIKISDRAILEKGLGEACGLHVLIASFMKDNKTLIQVIGRCARQDNKGSVEMCFEKGIANSLVTDMRIQKEFSEHDSSSVILDKLSDIHKLYASHLIQKRTSARDKNRFYHQKSEQLFTLLNNNIGAYAANGRLETIKGSWCAWYADTYGNPHLSVANREALFQARVGVNL